MKKIISLSLALCMCISLACVFTACSSEPEATLTSTPTPVVTPTPTPESNGVSAEDWAKLCSVENFANYTLKQTGTTVQDGVSMPSTQIVRFADGKAALSVTFEGSPEPMVIVLDGAEAEAQKKTYEDLYTNLLKNYADFQYDKEENVYKNSNTITVNLTMNDEDGDIAIVVVLNNAKITLTEDGKLAKFEGSIKQTTNIPGEGEIVSTIDDLVWEFSDFGTTVIAEEVTE